MSKINKQEIEKKEVNNIVETVEVGDVKENVETKEFKRKWKTIKNFKKTMDGIYEVSNDGLVRDKVTKKERHLKVASKLYHPYYAVSLKQINGDMAWVLVHQLVATFFVKKAKKYKGIEDLVVDHLDNNGLNNLYTNLEWKTHGENVKASNTRDDYQKHVNATFPKTEEYIHMICRLLETNMSYKEICENLNQPYEYNNVLFLRAIKKGKIHKNISDAYNIDRENIRYTSAQQVIASQVKLIRQLIEMGKTNMEITDEIWPGLPKHLRKSRSRIVKAIRDGKKYKDIQ